MSDRLRQASMHNMLLADLGEAVVQVDNYKTKPLLITLGAPTPAKLRIYMFNCTCPPGGRAPDEYKSQLIIEGQKKGERRKLEETDGRLILLIGVATPFDSYENAVYVLWEAEAHREFSFSANLQVKLEPMLRTFTDGVVVYRKKSKEDVVLAQRKDILTAISTRLDIDLQKLLEV